MKFQVIHISSARDLPVEASEEKEFLRQYGIKSVLLIPMVSGKELIGLTEFDATDKEKTWSNDEIALLGLVTETFVHILERKWSSEALTILSQRHELMNSISDGIYCLDMKGRATFVNPAAANMTGYSKEELLEKPLHDILHHTRQDGRPYPRQECPVCTVYKEKKILQVSNELFWRKDNTCFIAEYLCAPLMEKNELLGVMVAFQDVTERKEQQQEIERLAYYDPPPFQGSLGASSGPRTQRKADARRSFFGPGQLQVNQRHFRA